MKSLNYIEITLEMKSTGVNITILVKDTSEKHMFKKLTTHHVCVT